MGLFRVGKNLFGIFLFILFFITTSYSQELSPEQVFEKVDPAVVTIYVTGFEGSKPASQGSGVVLNEKGWVVTNYHVFAGGNKISIKHQDQIIPYSNIIGVDVEKDILILKIEDNTFPSLPIGDSDKLKVGQRVYAIGSPLGYENSFSEGVVSGLRSNEGRERNFVQFTAPISAGSSGGAVVNTKGELIGISTQTLRSSQNLNFAIPINDVLKVKIEDYSDNKKIEAFTYFFRGVSALDEKKDYDHAIENFRKSIELDSTNTNAFIQLSYAYLANQEYDSSVFAANEVIESYPDYYQPYQIIGSSFADRKDFDKAIPYFKKVIQLDSSVAGAYNDLAVCYVNKFELDSAIIMYYALLKKFPDNAQAHSNIAVCYQMKKMHQSAIEHYKKAIEIDPNFADYYYNLASALKDFEKYEEALKYIKKAIEKQNPNEPRFDYYYRYGQILYFLQRYEEAIAPLWKVTQLEPDRWRAYYLLSLAYDAMGQELFSKANYKEALKKNPNLKKDVKMQNRDFGLTITKEKYTGKEK